MATISSTLEWISSDSKLIFINNSASEFGGGIYIYPDVIQLRYKYFFEINCLYYKPLNDTNSTKPNIYFVNNSATIAGFDIYGASLFWCNRRNVDIHEITNNNEMSAISGDPVRVCKCDDENQPQCNIFSYTQDAYPGETIAIALVLVGGDWGPTPGTVYAHYTSAADSSNLIVSSQYNQLINSTQCTTLSHTLYTNQSVQLVLTAHSFLNPVFYDSCGKILFQ